MELGSKFGGIVAELKRETLGLGVGAPLPTALKNVEGSLCNVVIYKDQRKLPLPEEEFAILSQGRKNMPAIS